MNGELARCDFCGKTKPVLRHYIHAGNKMLDDNKQNIFTFIYYCSDCGIESTSQAPSTEYDRITKLIEPKIEEMKARYPKELNINGFEPALTSDIAEICLFVLASQKTPSTDYQQGLDDGAAEASIVCNEKTIPAVMANLKRKVEGITPKTYGETAIIDEVLAILNQ